MENNTIPQDIVKCNKIIAEFMGCYGDTHWCVAMPVLRYGFKDTHIFDRWHESEFDEQTHYHSSWDWLMPVVEKIENMGYIFTMSEKYCNIQDSKNNVSVTGVMYAPIKKEVVYNAIIKFLCIIKP